MLSLNFSAIATREASLGLPLDDLRVMSDVFGKIKSDYVETVPDKKLIREAINGMVAGLDPHSQFLDEEAFKDLQTNTVGRYGGLGIEVNMEDGLIKVITPMDDQPAARAGILSRRQDLSRRRHRDPRPDAAEGDRQDEGPAGTEGRRCA